MHDADASQNVGKLVGADGSRLDTLPSKWILTFLRLMSDYEVTLVNDNSKSTQGYAADWTLTSCAVYVQNILLQSIHGPRMALNFDARKGKNSMSDSRVPKRVCAYIERLGNHTHLSLKHPFPAVYGRSTWNSQISIHTKAPASVS